MPGNGVTALEKPILSRFPTICKLLAGRQFDNDIQKATELAAHADGRDRLKQEIKRKGFSSTRLVMFLACNTLLEMDDCTATGLEQDLQKLAGRVGLQKLQATFRDKLLEDKQFDDTVHEIAVAAVCSDFFDSGTLALEQRIAASRSGKKNSDIKGLRGGQQYRVEVTVLHDDWPPRLDEGFQEIIEGANTEAGYTVALARPVTTRAGAEKVKRLIEELAAARKASPESDVTVQGVEYLYCGGEYRPRQSTSPVDYIQFDDTTPTRLVGGPAVSRNTVDPQEWKKVKNPEGVFTSMDVKQDAQTHRATPLSTKIWQTLQDKLGQCEPDHINIVVIGLPNPIDDNEVLNALTGSVVGEVEVHEGAQGRRVGGEWKVLRLPTGPFVPEQQSEDPEQFVEAFRKLSAVWLFRLSSAYPRSALVLNPNASHPAEESPASELMRLGLQRARAGQNAEAPKAALLRLKMPQGRQEGPAAAEPSAETEDDVRRELALELVGNCGGLAQALETVSRLEALHSGGQQFTPAPQQGAGVSVDPLDIAEEFVGCCGGFDAARKCLEALRSVE
jgi:hypothetical protein